MRESDSYSTSAERFVQMIRDATVEPGMRGTLVWFPDRVISAYKLEGEEARATRTANLTKLVLPDDVRALALEVFDLHDLHSGE